MFNLYEIFKFFFMLSQTLTVYKVNKIQLYFPGCNKTEDYLPRQDFERQ